MLVTKHHDGVLLWPSEHPNPMKPELHASRNVVEELTDEVKARGMRMGFYYSSPFDWTFTKKPMTDLAMSLARIPVSKEYRDYATSHWHELIERYDPAVLWNDIGYPTGVNINETLRLFLQQDPGRGRERAVGADLRALKVSRLYAGHPAGGQLVREEALAAGAHQPARRALRLHHPEYTSRSEISEEKWECVRGIGKSFGYNRQEVPDDFLSVAELVRLLVDIVSKNGNLLLNVGPEARGRDPRGAGRPDQGSRRVALGQRRRHLWNAAVEEGRRADGRGNGVRFTSKPDCLFVILMETPRGPEVTIENLRAAEGMRVELLGDDKPLDWEQAGNGLMVRLGRRLPDNPAVCLKMTPGPSGL